jgi:hypothetical protein
MLARAREGVRRWTCLDAAAARALPVRSPWIDLAARAATRRFGHFTRRRMTTPTTAGRSADAVRAECAVRAAFASASHVLQPTVTSTGVQCEPADCRGQILQRNKKKAAEMRRMHAAPRREGIEAGWLSRTSLQPCASWCCAARPDPDQTSEPRWGTSGPLRERRRPRSGTRGRRRRRSARAWRTRGKARRSTGRPRLV